MLAIHHLHPPTTKKQQKQQQIHYEIYSLELKCRAEECVWMCHENMNQQKFYMMMIYFQLNRKKIRLNMNKKNVEKVCIRERERKT